MVALPFEDGTHPVHDRLVSVKIISNLLSAILTTPMTSPNDRLLSFVKKYSSDLVKPSKLFRARSLVISFPIPTQDININPINKLINKRFITFDPC